jgi:hypothetical protein
MQQGLMTLLFFSSVDAHVDGPPYRRLVLFVNNRVHHDFHNNLALTTRASTGYEPICTFFHATA